MPRACPLAQARQFARNVDQAVDLNTSVLLARSAPQASVNLPVGVVNETSRHVRGDVVNERRATNSATGVINIRTGRKAAPAERSEAFLGMMVRRRDKPAASAHGRREYIEATWLSRRAFHHAGRNRLVDRIFASSPAEPLPSSHPPSYWPDLCGLRVSLNEAFTHRR
jgi:hypothetical protein